MGSLEYKHSYKRRLFLIVIACIIVGLLFGALSLTLATLEGTSDCPAQPRPECPIHEKQPIPCPAQKSKPHCWLEPVK
ncbi:hypothetical protein C6501_10085 [Candidatus Poribacteria bacterium]|nr:MAG: hypothetical protein C6501_10085 [Candidatus Poribacteria bacterium]